MTKDAERKGRAMPQMFDWIFFAIMLPVPAFLAWVEAAGAAPAAPTLRALAAAYGP